MTIIKLDTTTVIHNVSMQSLRVTARVMQEYNILMYCPCEEVPLINTTRSIQAQTHAHSKAYTMLLYSGKLLRGENFHGSARSDHFMFIHRENFTEY